MSKKTRKQFMNSIKTLSLATILWRGVERKSVVKAQVNDNTLEDVSNEQISFTSADILDPSSFAEMPPVLKNKETTSSLFSKISTVIKNIRYIIKLIGNEDVSSIGDGTITGWMSQLNTDIVSAVAMSDGEFEETTEVPRDADTLGGLYTADDINAIKTKLDNLGEEADILFHQASVSVQSYTLTHSIDDYKELFIGYLAAKNKIIYEGITMSVVVAKLLNLQEFDNYLIDGNRGTRFTFDSSTTIKIVGTDDGNGLIVIGTK